MSFCRPPLTVSRCLMSSCKLPKTISYNIDTRSYSKRFTFPFFFCIFHTRPNRQQSRYRMKKKQNFILKLKMFRKPKENKEKIVRYKCFFQYLLEIPVEKITFWFRGEFLNTVITCW